MSKAHKQKFRRIYNRCPYMQNSGPGEYLVDGQEYNSEWVDEYYEQVYQGNTEPLHKPKPPQEE